MNSALRERRVAASWTQVELAHEAGVSRAQISGIEGGRHVPSVTTALALARALDLPLEELFPSAPVEAVPVVEPARDGAPLRLGRVGDRLVYAALRDRGAGAELFRAPDAVLRDGRVEILPGSETRGVVVAGCDPSLGLMADLLPRRGYRAVPVHATTADARLALAAGRCHAALVHGRSIDLRRRPADTVGYALARWRVGIASTASRALRLGALGDESKRLAQRDPGASAQKALLRALRREGADVRVRGPIAASHIDAARRASLGEVDGALTIEPCARAYELRFEPLEEHRVELWIGGPYAGVPGVQALGELIGSGAFRARLEGLAGYQLGAPGLTRL